MSRSPILAALVTVARALCHVLVVVFVGVWGYLSFPFPMPSLVWLIGAVVLAILVWALFLSPKPVLHTDRFGQAIVELAFLAVGVAAMYFTDTPMWVMLIFGIVAMLLSYVYLTFVRTPQRAEPASPTR